MILPGTVDAAVRRIVSPDNMLLTTLLFNETKRQGGNPREAEDQIKSAATKYFESTDDRQVFGMSGWGTKARCWIIRRDNNARGHKMEALFGPNDRGKRDAYIDANDDRAFYITASIALMRGDTHLMPDAFVAEYFAQQQSVAYSGHY